MRIQPPKRRQILVVQISDDTCEIFEGGDAVENMLAHVSELRAQMQETRIFEVAEEIQVEYVARIAPKVNTTAARGRRKRDAGCGVCARGTLLCPH
jgi:hypothetical protein